MSRSAPPLPARVAAAVRPHTGPISRVAPVGGGCIANASRVDAEGGTFFLKWAGAEVGASFEAEAHGLRALRSAGAPLRIPEPLAAQDGEGGAPGLLLMEWLPEAPPTPPSWRRMGEGLAALHRSAPPPRRYGFDRDNVIGRLPQQNGWHDRWPDFFRAERLAPQIAMARGGGRWRPAWDRPAEALLARLGDLLPEAPHPSLLHGDLWSGNALSLEGGEAALVDPAAYYGHREADLAMTELFGGFDRAFYEAYYGAWPPEAGYEERREVYNLYHLLSHLNHFGGGYAGQVEGALRRFG